MAKPHKHKWSKQYRGIFNGPCRVCLNGRCGAIRQASGHIIKVCDRTGQAPSRVGRGPVNTRPE